MVDDHDRRPHDERDDNEDGSGHRGDQGAGSSDDAGTTEWNEGVRGEGGAEMRSGEDENSRRDDSRGNEPVAEDGLEFFERGVREASEKSGQWRSPWTARTSTRRDVGAGACLELPELGLGQLGLTDSEIAHLLRIEGDDRIFLRGPRRLLDHLQAGHGAVGQVREQGSNRIDAAGQTLLNDLVGPVALYNNETGELPRGNDPA